MSVMAMKRLNICAMNRDKKQIIETLQAFQVLELDDTVFEKESLDSYATNEEKIANDRKANEIENALDAINMYVPEQKGMLSALEGRKKVPRAYMNQIVSQSEDIEAVAKKATGGMKKIIENRVDIDRNKVAMQALEPWLNLDIPMEFTHTKRAAFMIGTILPVSSEEEVFNAIGNHLVDLADVDVSIVHTDKYQTCVVAVCLREYEDAVENGLHSLGFARISNAFEGIPQNEKEKLEKQNQNLAEEIEEIIKGFQVLAERREDLKALSDYYRMEAAKADGMSKINESKQAFFISGFVPSKSVDSLAKMLDEKFLLHYEIKNIDEEEEAPVLLKNSSMGASVESVVESYGLPQKKEIDPSSVMSWFYVFLFGLMLSDAAYGFIMFLSCFLLLGKYKDMEPSMKKSVKLFMYCGISTLVWGVLFGGYFGDAIDIISKTFFDKQISIQPLWFAPLNDPMKLLMFCMLFGMIHLFTGLALKGYICIRDKRYMDFFCDVVLWFAMLVGLVLLLLPSELFYSLSQIKFEFSPFMASVSKWLAIGGALGIVLMSGRSSKNVGLRLALGAYDLYNLTGWLSDLLSYSRLLALGLATGVIASVINQIGSMGGSSVVGIALFIIVFIFGHIFNMAINLLGAYVHTNRLQYVEFFSKFYEGGGRAFNPFKRNTKYIEVGEEK